MNLQAQGLVEHLARDQIRGWAIDLQAPDYRPVVELLFDGRTVAVARAELPRPDLASPDLPRNDVGFRIEVPREVVLDVDRVRLQIAGSGTALPIAPAATRHEGVLEGVSATQAGGWAWRIGYPGERPRVVLLLDGRTIARVPVSRFREDLKAAGVGDGRYGFNCDLPPGYPEADLAPGRLRAEVEGTGVALLDLRGPPKPQPARQRPKPARPQARPVETPRAVPEPVKTVSPPAPPRPGPRLPAARPPAPRMPPPAMHKKPAPEPAVPPVPDMSRTPSRSPLPPLNFLSGEAAEAMRSAIGLSDEDGTI